MSINIEEIKQLAISPDIPVLGDVAHIRQVGDKLFIELHFYDDEISEQVERLVGARYAGIDIAISTKIEAKRAQPNVALAKRINNVVAIASGKGGVGKSSIAINLALAMAASGARVGILDADIYGPSQPTMLGKHERPEITAKKMKPVRAHGIESNSIGYLMDAEVSMIWRAPMIVGALQQLMNDTLWGSYSGGKLDYLFIDLPPGTGDIQLTMAQKIAVTGAVVVTTPQDIALIDARRALAMFAKTKIDTLGIVENMSTHICPECGHESQIFGRGGGISLAEQVDVPFLADIALDIALRQSLDAGEPLMVAAPEHPISRRFASIARQIAIAIAHKPRSYSQAFGKIIVESS